LRRLSFFRWGELHVKGLTSVSIWVYLVFTAMLAAAAAANGNGLEN